MPTIEYENVKFQIDSEGFLENFDDWCPAWINLIANQEEITEMTEDHWRVINILREYYKIHKTAPMVRILSKLTDFKLKYLYELFPSGPGKGACKMAGLPKPTGCV